ncbi:MAG: HAMP domain-containing protein [bacterium]|nr:MAG: HAMP domain-containing protein [bacterium]
MRLSFPRFADNRSRMIAVAIILVFIFLLIFLGDRYGDVRSDDPRGGNLFIFFLININLLLLTVLIVLLTRNAIKLIYESRRRTFGYRLRTRLVVIFVGFSLVPTLLLFYVATGFINDSIEYWFHLNLDRVVEGSVSISQDYYSTMTERVKILAQRVSDRIGVLEPDENILEIFENLRRDYALSSIEIYDAEGQSLVRAWDGISPQDITGSQGGLVQNAIIGRVVDSIVRVDKGELVKGAAPIATREGQGAVVVSIHLTETVRTKADLITETYREYTEMKLQKGPIRANYLAYLLLLTMLILFSASWLGFYIARGITVPIGLLAEGTERVASGDLSTRVNIQASDEIGVLVQAFNRMTEQLQSGRSDLEAAHEDLRVAYAINEERRAYIETVLQNIGAGVVTIDMAGRITTFNNAVENIFSIRAEEVLGKRYDRLLRPEHGRILERILNELEKGRRKNVRREVPLVFRGAAMVLSLNVSALEDPEGETIGFVIVLEDMTKLVNAQKKAAWSEVAKRIAHEIKNPLTPIKLSAERIRRKFAEQGDKDVIRVVRESTDSIIREVDAMRNLVDEFSRFARLPVIRSVPNDLNEVVQEALGPYQEGHAVGRKIDLHLEAGLPQVSFDREQMKRVLVNLIENAVRAIQDRGEGGVEVSTGLLGDEGMAAVVVADEGVGIPLETRERIFDPYFSTKNDGMGLGLAIAMRIVEEHGGTIHFEENNPRGSTFVVKIPVDVERNV